MSKVALLVSGGGAKGAFAQGALEIISGCESHPAANPDLVAGTSIGGLMALSHGNRQLERSGEVWTDLSPWKLLQPTKIARKFRGGVLLQLLFMVIGGFNFLLNLLIASFERQQYLAMTGLPTGFLRWVFVGITLLFNWLVLSNIPWCESIAIITSAHTTFALCLISWWRSFYAPMLVGSLLLGLPVFGLLGFAEAAFAAIAFSYLVALILVAAWFLFIHGAKTKLALLSQKAIGEVLAPFVERKPALPTYVCVGIREEAIDLDAPMTHFPEEPRDARAAMHGPPYIGLAFHPGHRYGPVYRDIAEVKSSDERLKYLMATAALPLGLAAPVVVNKQGCLDGGVADNMPLLAVLRSEVDIQEITAIFLTPPTDSSGNDIDLTTQRGQQEAIGALCRDLDEVLRREMEIRVLPLLKETIGISGWVVPRECEHAYAERVRIQKALEPILQGLKAEADVVRQKFRTIRVQSIAPVRPLGNFFSGTLNFTKRATSRFCAAGREQARRVLTAIDGPLLVSDALDELEA